MFDGFADVSETPEFSPVERWRRVPRGCCEPLQAAVLPSCAGLTWRRWPTRALVTGG